MLFYLFNVFKNIFQLLLPLFNRFKNKFYILQNLFCDFLLFFQKKGLAYGFQVFFVFVSIKSHAFLSEVLGVKKKVEGASLALDSVIDTIKQGEKLLKVENEFLYYEKELREFKKTLDEYERLGLDVKDFIKLRTYDPSSLRQQINFFKDYFRRANNLLKSFKSLTESPESITASQQIETNRTLRALLEDNQTRELRRLRAEIAKQKILLDRRKKEQEFINKQYSYINRHSKKSGFGLFHPFQNRNELKNKKQKKFLGFF